MHFVYLDMVEYRLKTILVSQSILYSSLVINCVRCKRTGCNVSYSNNLIFSNSCSITLSSAYMTAVLNFLLPSDMSPNKSWDRALSSTPTV